MAGFAAGFTGGVLFGITLLSGLALFALVGFSAALFARAARFGRAFPFAFVAFGCGLTLVRAGLVAALFAGLADGLNLSKFSARAGFALFAVALFTAGRYIFKRFPLTFVAPGLDALEIATGLMVVCVYRCTSFDRGPRAHAPPPRGELLILLMTVTLLFMMVVLLITVTRGLGFHPPYT